MNVKCNSAFFVISLTTVDSPKKQNLRCSAGGQFDCAVLNNRSRTDFATTDNWVFFIPSKL